MHFWLQGTVLLINLHIFRRECSIWIWHGCDCNLPWLIPRHWWPDSESSSYIPIPHLLDCLRHVHFWQPCLQYYIQRERERQRKSRSLFAAAKKKQLKVSPKDKSWGGIRASLPFCVYCLCVSSAARDLHYFNPFILFRSYYMQLKKINKCQNDDGVVSF